MIIGTRFTDDGMQAMKPLSLRALALCLFATLAAAPTILAEVYKWVDENGVVHYSDRPPQQGTESAELAITTRPPEQTGDVSAAASTQPETPWYEQWLAEQRERRLQEKQARDAARSEQGAEKAQMLETCAQARYRLGVLERPCRVFFDGRGELRSWCRYETTFAWSGEFRFLEDDERAVMLRHYREQVAECVEAGY